MLAKLAELLARLGVFRLLLALKAISSLFTGFIASRIRAHSRSVHTKAKYGTDKYIELSGYKLHYVETGEGLPLLLLSGAFSTYRTFNRVVPLLEEHFRIIAIDHLGAGSSDKPTTGFSYTVGEQAKVLAEFINQLGLDRVCIVGVRYGAAVACTFAFMFPESVEKVVCIEECEPELPHWMETLLSYPLLGDLVISALKTNFFNSLILRHILPERYQGLSSEDRAELLEELFYNTSSATRTAWYKLNRASSVDNANCGHNETEVLFIHGAGADRPEQYLPKAIYLHGAVRYLHLQLPEAVANIVKEFASPCNS